MSGNSPAEVASDILSEFFEVAFHSILHARKLYPSSVFVQKRKYSVPVQVVANPEVTKYIQDAIGNLKPLLRAGSIGKICFVTLNKQHQIQEKFVFEISTVQGQQSKDRLETSLRGFLMKLRTCDSVLNPCIGSECTWTLQVHMREAASDPLQTPFLINDFTWTETKACHVDNPNIIPMKALDSDILQMQLYVVEEAMERTNKSS